MAHNRQALLFGAASQDILRRQRIAIIGLGGAGSLINEEVARLGVGHLVLIDADRIETTNLSRVVGATRFDAHTRLTNEDRPGWVRQLGGRLAAPKVRIAKRVAKQASRHTRVDVVHSNVEDPDAWKQLIGCDHIFLAADAHTARLLVNAIAHQYLILVTQIGAKAQVEDTGNVSAVYSVSRPIEPGRTVAASVAVNEWLMRTVVGPAQRPITPDWITVDALFGEFHLDGTRQDPDCPWCGTRRYGRGDALPLPAKIR